jgi:hypothetical protein
MISLVRSAGIPAPEVLFFSADAEAHNNLLGFEYICMESSLLSPFLLLLFLT